MAAVLRRLGGDYRATIVYLRLGPKRESALTLRHSVYPTQAGTVHCASHFIWLRT